MSTWGKSLLIIGGLALVFIGIGAWWWSVRANDDAPLMDIQYDLPGDATYRTFAWSETPGGQAVTFHVVTIPADGVSASLWFHGPGTPDVESIGIGAVADQTDAEIVINGGYFDAGFNPVGLAVREGVEVSPVTDEAALSGFVWLSDSGQIGLAPRSGGVPTSQNILQAGPFLIDPGGGIGIRTDDHRRQRRSVVALGGKDGDTLILVVADAISLHALAQLMHDHPAWFGVTSIDRALNLDGGPSSALYLDVAPGQEVVPAHGPVQNYIVFRER